MSRSLNRSAGTVASALVASWACFASPASIAADKYAVLSAIGNALTIVTYQPGVGSNLDANLRQVVPLADDSFDQVAVQAAEAAIHRAVPDAETVALPSPDRSVFLFDDAQAQRTDLTTAQIGEIGKGAAEHGARYLVLIAKSRGETRLPFLDGITGQGKLFGIGFYFDRLSNVQERSTGEHGRGFVAPYAYLTLTLIDLQAGKVLRTRAETETSSIPNTILPTVTHPWEAASAETKVRALNDMVRKAVVDAVPHLLPPT